MGIGPVFAVPKLLKKHGLKADDIDLWELNEAFASQVLYCRDTLGIPMEKLNVNGGSIAIGHPFGMTGSRLVGTLANEMARRRPATASSRCVWAAARARPPCSNAPSRRRPYFSFAAVELLTEIALVAELPDLVHLRFEEVDVLLFVLEQPLEQVGRTVVARLARQLD